MKAVRYMLENIDTGFSPIDVTHYYTSPRGHAKLHNGGCIAGAKPSQHCGT